MENKNKRGISPLIATVLVIGFTIVLAALVITWGTRLFKTTVSETETAAKFSQACSAGLKLEVESKDYTPDSLSVTLRNNNQDQNINKFRVILNYGTGSYEGAMLTESLTSFVPKTYTITTSTTETAEGAPTDLAGLESVDLYPELTITGDTKFCENPTNIEV